MNLLTFKYGVESHLLSIKNLHTLAWSVKTCSFSKRTCSFELLAQRLSLLKNGQISYYAQFRTCDLIVIQGGLWLLWMHRFALLLNMTVIVNILMGEGFFLSLSPSLVFSLCVNIALCLSKVHKWHETRQNCDGREQANWVTPMGYATVCQWQTWMAWQTANSYLFYLLT